jgi:O-antigen ligase
MAFVYYLLLMLGPYMEYPRFIYGNGITLIKIVGALAAIFACAVLPLQRRAIWLWRYTEVKLFCLLVLAVTVSAVAQGPRSGAWTTLLAVLSLLIFAFVTMVFVNSFQVVRRSCLAILASMFVASLYVYNDYIRWHNFRPSGIVGDPNYCAILAVTVLPMSVFFLRGSNHMERGFLLATAASLVASTLLGASRGGFIAIVICFLYVAFRLKRFIGTTVVAGAVMLFFLAVLPSSPLQRLLEPSREAAYSTLLRKQLARAGMEMIRQNPLTGVGVSRFKQLSADYNPELGRIRLIGHNTYVEVAEEMGIPMLLVFLTILVLTWNRARRMAAYCQAKQLRIGEQLARSIEIAIPCYAVMATFLSAEFIRNIWMLVFLGLALDGILLRETGASRLPRAGGYHTWQPARTAERSYDVSQSRIRR